MQIEAFSRRCWLAQNRRRYCGGRGYEGDLLMERTQHGESESFTATTLAMQKWQKVLFLTKVLPKSTNQHLVAGLCCHSYKIIEAFVVVITLF
jgi:hypothetical protein